MFNNKPIDSQFHTKPSFPFEVWDLDDFLPKITALIHFAGDFPITEIFRCCPPKLATAEKLYSNFKAKEKKIQSCYKKYKIDLISTY